MCAIEAIRKTFRYCRVRTGLTLRVTPRTREISVHSFSPFFLLSFAPHTWEKKIERLKGGGLVLEGRDTADIPKAGPGERKMGENPEKGGRLHFRAAALERRFETKVLRRGVVRSVLPGGDEKMEKGMIDDRQSIRFVYPKQNRVVDDATWA